jgi:anti-anti-sigma factor
MDSTGLAFLVGIRDIARQRHGTVVLHDPSPTLLRLLHAMALDQAFEVSHNGQGPTQTAT